MSRFAVIDRFRLRVMRDAFPLGRGGPNCRRLATLALLVALSSGWCVAFAAPAPVPAPNRSTAPESQPPIIFSPHITVPPALPPPINVQVPEPGPLKSWAPVGISVFSAMSAAFSAAASIFLAWRYQNWNFVKDRASVIRDYRAKAAEAGLLAYENNVARPVGAVLDQVEKMINDILKIRPVPAAERNSQLETWGTSVIADQANNERLCSEADGALFGNPARAVFAPVFVRRGIDSLFLAAIGEALAGPPGERLEQLLNEVKELKVEMRRHLEQERQARWIGDITEDPFYDEIRHLIRQPAATS